MQGEHIFGADLVAQAACAKLSLLDGVRIFFSAADGGEMRRTTAHPRSDTHSEARRLCGHCPVLEQCLSTALREDMVSFRGLSPEERATFGGARAKRVRHRSPKLSAAQVLRRVLDAGYDIETVLAVLARHDVWLRNNPLPGAVVTAGTGWGEAWLAGDETTDELTARLDP